eukprot:gene11415-13489_t
MKNIGDRSTEKWQTAQSAATASTGDDTCRAAKSMTLQQQASKRFEEFLSTLQRHWRKAKMAFEDIQTTPTDLPTDAYIAEADGVGTAATTEHAAFQMQLVLEYFQSTMREGVDAVLLHHGGTATAYEYYEKPAALGRCRDSPDQIFHLDIWPFAIETALGAVRMVGAEAIHTFSALLCLDDQACTEVWPDTQLPQIWNDGDMRLPDACQGYPTSHPFERTRHGGGPGWVTTWPATHVAHGGISPGRTDDWAAFRNQRSLSICMYAAVSVLPTNATIDLENRVNPVPHSLRVMYGLPTRLVCVACKAEIRFQGSVLRQPVSGARV